MAIFYSLKPLTPFPNPVILPSTHLPARYKQGAVRAGGGTSRGQQKDRPITINQKDINQ